MALNINHAANFSIPFTSCLIFVFKSLHNIKTVKIAEYFTLTGKK